MGYVFDYNAPKKIYAVKVGKNPETGEEIRNVIFSKWKDCFACIKGVNGARYKGFLTIEEAKEYLSKVDIYMKKDNDYPKDCISVYVDGSYNSVTGQFSYALVAIENQSVVRHIESGRGKLLGVRNIRQIAGELVGALKGVQYAQGIGERKVAIIHDYVGICYHATGFWERKEESSKEYFKNMQQMMRDGMEIAFVKVDAHSGDLFNELADELCKYELGIESTNVISKWLENNKIEVVDENVMSIIQQVAPNSTIENFKII